MSFATTKNINKTSFFVARGGVFILYLNNMSNTGNYKKNIPEEIVFNKSQFEYEMRILQTNSETVTITLRHYEELKSRLTGLEKEVHDLIDNCTEVLNNNEDYVLSKNYASFVFSNNYFYVKKGINPEIDNLKETIESLREKLNRKYSFWYKLKNLFK